METGTAPQQPTSSKLPLALPLFLFGAVVGAVVGVLFAPDSGKETRRKMGHWLKEQGEKGKEKVGAVLEKGKVGLHAKKEQVEEAIEAGKKAFREVEKKVIGV